MQITTYIVISLFYVVSLRVYKLRQIYSNKNFCYVNAIKFILVNVGYIECASCGLAQPRRYVFLFVMDFLVNNIEAYFTWNNVIIDASSLIQESSW